MTKEQEVIKYIETRIKICNENADICDDNDFDEEATYLREESYMLETVLSMLKQKDKEIEELKQALARNIAKNFTSSMKESAKSKEDLEMLNKGWQIELEKKNKQIDLMAKAMDKIQDPQVCKYCDNNINSNHGYCVDAGKCKEGIKQYFEKLAKEKKII